MVTQPLEPDACFGDARWAAMYDQLDANRADLEHYVAIVDELDASSVLDIGCGTGVLALMLADEGVDVVGVDPASASLTVARSKPGSGRVRWIDGDATTLDDATPPPSVELALMTGNVAQVFLTDEAWMATLLGARRALRPGGHVVFETRIPSRRAWEQWTREASAHHTDVEGVGRVESWVDVTHVDLPFVTFDGVVRLPDGQSINSTSTLRFRERAEVEASLVDAGFTPIEVREAPDRPGKEFVFIARRTDDGFDSGLGDGSPAQS